MRANFIAIGGLLAALAVAAGAFGAHGLKDLVRQGRFPAEYMETFETAVRYQMFHALGLILVGLLAKTNSSVALTFSGWMMCFGIAMFCGFLYLYVATGVKIFAMLVPIGGLAFIVAWLSVAYAAWGK